ncbi:MAG: alpha-L-fucosidase [Fibrobacterales bacterium]
MKFFICSMVLVSTILSAQYSTDWSSLEQREIPEWFPDAKFGIFIHWGVYSVPAWTEKGNYSEWYWDHLVNGNFGVSKHHADTYGNAPYQDFAKNFTAENYDPEAWAELFKNAGAKYVVPTSKHHEGYCLWECTNKPNWNAVDVGAKKDLLGPLTTAVKGKGLKMGFYYSLLEWHNDQFDSDLDTYVSEVMIPDLKDLVTKYEPDLLWPDGEWDHDKAVWHSAEFLSWLFSESPVKDQIVVNDRWGQGRAQDKVGYWTTEYGKWGGTSTTHPWEECRGLGHSFGYNQVEGPEDYSTVEELVHLLVTTVSGGGNLLLNIGPKADGTIPDVMQERLLGLGDWLSVNGEAMYNTRARIDATPEMANPYFTRSKSKEYIYALFTALPNGSVIVPGAFANTGSEIVLLADTDTTSLEWSNTAEGIVISGLDQVSSLGDHAWAFKIQGALHGETKLIAPQHIDTLVRGALHSIAWLSQEEGGQISLYSTIGSNQEITKGVMTGSTHWSEEYSAVKAYDDNTTTRWSATEGQVTDQWLEIDFGEMTTFNSVVIKEHIEFGLRVASHRIEYYDGISWVSVAEGATIGSSKEYLFEGVTAQKVRLYIPMSSVEPTIADIQVFNSNVEHIISGEVTDNVLEWEVPQYLADTFNLTIQIDGVTYVRNVVVVDGDVQTESSEDISSAEDISSEMHGSSSGQLEAASSSESIESSANEYSLGDGENTAEISVMNTGYINTNQITFLNLHEKRSVTAPHNTHEYRLFSLQGVVLATGEVTDGTVSISQAIPDASVVVLWY